MRLSSPWGDSPRTWDWGAVSENETARYLRMIPTVLRRHECPILSHYHLVGHDRGRNEHAGQQETSQNKEHRVHIGSQHSVKSRFHAFSPCLKQRSLGGTLEREIWFGDFF